MSAPYSPFDSTRVAEGPHDWRKAVREQFNKGADLIKLASHFSREEVKAAIEEAHALGLKVAVDCETFYVQWAVEAGADVIEHPLPRADQTIELMARNGTQADPTLVAYIYIFGRRGGYYNSTSRRFTFSKESILEMLRKMKNAGIKMGIGTDIWFGLHRFQPIPYITELRQFVKAGFSIPEALIAATKNGAEILDMGDRLGTLEPGKLADILVVDGKPDLDLDDLANVEMVIRDGYVVVKEGRVVIPRHVPPDPSQLGLVYQ
jgi:imidazolonepropionase-like amidohydrolase